jgi:hypothetical protein
MIAAGSLLPPGEVTISINGASATPTIDADTGAFSATFNTSGLGASSTPYTITYSYHDTADSNLADASDTSTALTVNPATLTVTATNLSKVYGGANPTLTYTIAGFVNGDTSSVVSGKPTLSTTATTSSAVGSYTITVKQNALSAANYTFSLVNGALAITPKKVTSQVTVTKGTVKHVSGSTSKSAYNFTEVVTIKNTGSTTILGPIYLELSKLPSKVTAVTSKGAALSKSASGVPYLKLSGSNLGKGTSLSIALYFYDPSLTAVSYTASVWSGGAP